MQYYDFIDAPSDVKSLIHSINLHGDNLVGLELGVFRGASFCTLLQNCPNIKTLYGIDSWQPYKDYLKDPYDGNTWAYDMDEKEIKFIRLQALHNIEYSGYKQKAVIIEKDSDDALDDFQDQSLDFIFVDAYMTYEQAVNDMEKWYPKLKEGGLFTGHDYHISAIKNAVAYFRKSQNINSRMSTFDKCFIWKK